MTAILKQHNKMNKILGILAIVVLFSCNNGGTNFKKDPTLVKLKIIDTTFFQPSRLTSLNKSLLFLDNGEDFLIHLYDPSNKKRLYDGYHVGRGPNEILAPVSIQVTQENIFWIHDGVLQQFHKFLLIGDSIKVLEKIKFNSLRILYPNFISDSTLIALNILESSKGWVIKIDAKGNYLGQLVSFPANKLNYPENILTESYQGKLLVKPGGEKFVLACRYSDLLSIYDNQGGLVSTYRTKYPFDPIMKVSTVGQDLVMGQDDDTMIGFTDISVSKNFIFAVFSGKSRKEPNPTISNTILQFNWDGKLLNSFLVDLPISNICWSESDNALYMIALKNGYNCLARMSIN